MKFVTNMILFLRGEGGGGRGNIRALFSIRMTKQDKLIIKADKQTFERNSVSFYFPKFPSRLRFQWHLLGSYAGITGFLMTSLRCQY